MTSEAVLRKSWDENADHTRSSIVVRATPAEVLRVIADIEAYPQWVGEVRTAEVVEPGADGRPKRARLVIDAGPLREEQVHRYVWHGDRAVTWNLESSRVLRDLAGAYTVTPVDDAHSQVEYRLSVQLAVPIISLLKRRAEKIVIERALTELKHHVETQHA